MKKLAEIYGVPTPLACVRLKEAGIINDQETAFFWQIYLGGLYDYAPEEKKIIRENGVKLVTRDIKEQYNNKYHEYIPAPNLNELINKTFGLNNDNGIVITDKARIAAGIRVYTPHPEKQVLEEEIWGELNKKHINLSQILAIYLLKIKGIKL